MSRLQSGQDDGALLKKMQAADEPLETLEPEQHFTIDTSTDDTAHIVIRAPKSSATVNGAGGGPRRTKFLSIWRYLTLRGLFQLLGQSVGSYPLVYIALSLLISSCSFGMFKMVLKDRIRDGYTPTNAPSRYEMDVIREFWNSTGDPMMTVVLLTANDGGSMLRYEYLEEVVRLDEFLHSNLTIEYNGESVKYNDFCKPYCDLNIAIKSFKAGLDEEIYFLQRGKPLPDGFELSYPVAKINNIDFHLERNFFGVRKKELPNKNAFVGQNITGDNLPANKSYSQLLSNMDFVKVILIVYRGDKATVDLDRMLSSWELAVFAFSREQYRGRMIDMQVIGTEILDQEMIRDGQKLTPYFAAGFGFMMVFVTATVLMSAVFYNAMDAGKLLVASGSILCPILSISTTYGIVSLCGIRTNSFMLVMPFLIMGIGVDDGFLMIHAWQRLALVCSSVSVRLGMVFEEVGPSITITSLTNFISFGIGALTPTPEVRLFCVATAIAMGLDYLYELILFGPILALATRCEKKKSVAQRTCASAMSSPLQGWRLEIDKFMKWVLRVYCRIIGHRLFTVSLVGATIVYWYFAVLGALNIKTRLDTVKILPKDSPIQAPNRILNDIIWAEYHPVTILVNKELDISERSQMDRFWQMVNEFESLPQCRGNISTLLWIRDYENYYVQGDPLYRAFFGAIEPSPTKKPKDKTKTGIDFDKLDEFLSSPFYKHWKTFMKLDETPNGLRVKRFWFTVAYQNTSSWEQRIDIMQQWRSIAQNYKDLNVTVWESNGMFVDQMLSLKTVAVQTGALTLICMAVVCAIFIPNPCSVITASIAIASISLGVFGFLSWWHFDLDPVTMAAVLMSIGLSVDFTAHVSYHYQLTNRKEIRNGKIIKIPMKGPQEKLEHTLQSVGWPMIQAGASTVMCVLPLLFLQSYSPIVFLKTIFLVVAWGLLHGLIVLPAFLGSLPDCLTNANCYRTFLSTSSERSCRYTGPKELEGQDNDVSE